VHVREEDLSTVRTTTAADAMRTGCERSNAPSASSTTPNASHTAEYVYCSASEISSVERIGP
jgi:hypothetical protein